MFSSPLRLFIEYLKKKFYETFLLDETLLKLQTYILVTFIRSINDQLTFFL